MRNLLRRPKPFFETRCKSTWFRCFLLSLLLLLLLLHHTIQTQYTHNTLKKLVAAVCLDSGRARSILFRLQSNFVCYDRKRSCHRHLLLFCHPPLTAAPTAAPGPHQLSHYLGFCIVCSACIFWFVVERRVWAIEFVSHISVFASKFVSSIDSSPACLPKSNVSVVCVLLLANV